MKKKSKGSTLALTIIVMAVLSVLGLAMLQVSLFETKNAVRSEKHMKAYYLAKSGAEATASWIEKNPSNVSNIVGKTSQDTKLDSTINGSFRVDVKQDPTDEDKLIINSTAMVDGITNTASLEMVKSQISSPAEVFGYALYSDSAINLKGSSSINGDVRSSKEINNNDKGGGKKGITGDIYPFTPMDLPIPVFPADPSKALDLTIGNNQVLGDSVGTMLVYRKLTLSGGTLTFNTMNADGSTSHNLTIVVEELGIHTGAKDGIVVKGSGTVTIYAKKVLQFDTAINKNGLPRQIFFVLGEGAKIDFKSNDTMKMFVYGPKCEVSSTGTPNIYGGLIVGEIEKMSGNVDITNIPTYSEGLPIDMITGVRYVRGSWIK